MKIREMIDEKEKKMADVLAVAEKYLVVGSRMGLAEVVLLVLAVSEE